MMHRKIFGRCGACGHVWPILSLPTPIDVAARAMNRATCPECGHTEIFIPTEAQMVAAGYPPEQQETRNEPSQAQVHHPH